MKPISRSPGGSAAVIPDVAVRQWGDNTCGAAALATVLNHHGDPITEEALNERFAKGRNRGVVSVDLLLAARERGFGARLVRGDVELVRRSISDGKPLILMLQVLNAPGVTRDLYHYVVVDGFDPRRNRARMHFGDGRTRWAPLASAMNRFGLLKTTTGAWASTGFATLIVDGPMEPEERERRDLRRAVLLEEGGRLEEAIRIYREMIDRRSDSVIAWTNLGNAEYRLGNRAASEDAYRQALVHDPEHRDALNNLAWNLLERKKLVEAEELAQRAVRAPGPDAHLYYDTLGRIQLARHRCDDAAQAFRQALADTDLRTRRSDLLFVLAQADQQCGRVREATDSLRAAIAEQPSAETKRQIESLLAQIGASDP